jgi:hypothetical protein
MNCGGADAVFGFTPAQDARRFRSGFGSFFTEFALTGSSTTSDIAANFQAADFPGCRRNTRQRSTLTCMWTILKASGWRATSTVFES